ncbi:tRNA lysidine(34) synthetase TilS [Marinomonas sp. 2405UD66-6]|uniref:tRNA lysidine(34) synthetase TilS n=1 Tax=Marinomonas sp. 2405UD66-6 TaxID=3391834 RepID=UPI0039C96B95
MMKQMLPNPIHSSSPLCFNQAWLDCVFSAAETVWVGFSGGVDSHVLLHAVVAQLSCSQRKKLVAVHVHHGLSDNADDWLAHCETVCQQLEVRFVAQRVQLETQASLEDAARNARYQVFESVMSANDVLLLAHHAGDQVETVLFRLLRGTGGKGLSGIPEQRSIGQQEARLLRPFLSLSKVDIEHYAKHHELQWIVDESNVDESFSRNFIRHSLVPKAQQRFPNMESNIVSTAKRVETDYAILSRFAQRQLALWCNEFGGLALHDIADLPTEERQFWLREFLARSDISVPHAQLKNLDATFFSAEDKQPEMQLAKHRLLRHQNRLYLLPLDQTVVLGKLQEGQKLVRAFDLATVHGTTDCELRTRPHGVNLILPNGKTRSLKKWLNDQGIPSWWREHLPYIYQHNELVAIGDLWAHPDWQGKVEWEPSERLPLLKKK